MALAFIPLSLEIYHVLNWLEIEVPSDCEGGLVEDSEHVSSK